MAELSDLTAQCIRCGFCLEACPTFQLTGDESQSPRGRISLAKQAEDSGWNSDTQAAIDSCLGCRACETACPSGVQYGKILEIAREQSNSIKANQNKARKSLVNSLTSPPLARIQFALADLLPNRKMPEILNQLVASQPATAQIPKPQEVLCLPDIPKHQLPPIKGSVYLLEGCVMKVLFPNVHQATRRLLRRVGFEVLETNAGCCGALHAHNGYLAEAELKAQQLSQHFLKDIPIIVNSAGCGSTLKEYGQIIGKGQSKIAEQTMDITEFLHQQNLSKLFPEHNLFNNKTLTYHDACHLAHGQKITSQPRDLIQAIPGSNYIELPEANMCCGSAGTYNVFQPKSAHDLLTRKWENIQSTQAMVVASGNPGCHAWIQQASQEHSSPIKVMHIASLLEAVFTPEVLD